jgi:hypothetical protein
MSFQRKAQLTITTDPSKDPLQFRDQHGTVIAFVSRTDGALHHFNDGTGVLPTHDAVKIISIGQGQIGPGSASNCLILYNSIGTAIGWIDGNGNLGGTL